MPVDDLKSHATSSQHDFYGLLDVPPSANESEIRRAYRKTALKYHPDKNAGNPSAIEKFHLLQIAYDVLSDPTVKELYDNAQRAKEEKKARDQAFEGRRKWMKEDLEKRESGAFKRKRDEEDEEEKFERELRRLAEDGQRRRKEREDALHRERLEEEERLEREKEGIDASSNLEKPKGGAEVSELDRTVKVRWVVDDANIDKEKLSSLFSKFGNVEHALLGKEKRLKIDGHKEKQRVATGMIVYTSVVGAHAAVEDWRKQASEYQVFRTVYWAANKEPDFLPQSPAPARETGIENGPETPIKPPVRHKIPGLDTAPSTPTAANGNGIRKVPSFASFNTPKAAASPSLEELTMIRLKNAEKRRLEEQIRKEDAAAETF